MVKSTVRDLITYIWGRGGGLGGEEEKGAGNSGVREAVGEERKVGVNRWDEMGETVRIL